MAEGARDTSWIALDDSLRVGVQQTLRVPDAGGPYPLPPALGRLPVHPAGPFSALAPPGSASADFVAALYRDAAVWLQFNGKLSEPRALKIAVGQVDAVTGQPWHLRLETAPQNYLVCPYQPWLDGFKSGAGLVRQFVAVPLDAGLTVEHQLTGQDEGGITLACFRPKQPVGEPAAPPSDNRSRDLGIGAGGEIRQRLYPDPYGIATWEATPVAVVRLRLIEAYEFARVTGEPVAPSTIDAATYTRFGLPWFEVYDSARGDLPVTAPLSTIKSVEALGGPAVDAPDESPPRPTNVRPIPPRSRGRE